MNKKLTLKEYVKIGKFGDILKLHGFYYMVLAIGGNLNDPLVNKIWVEKKKGRWVNRGFNAERMMSPELELEVITNNKNMKLTSLFKKLVDKDTRIMVEAGFLSEDFQLTEIGANTILGLIFLERKEDIAKLAQEKLDDEKNKTN